MSTERAECVKCRRLGTKLFLKGDRCFTDKCSLERKKSTLRVSRGRLSQYAQQLREKQKLRWKYGIKEKQFENYYRIAEKSRGVAGEELLRLLERRLDNVIWRLGFCTSRSQARQLVFHGHFLVNGQKVKTPSYLIKEKDVIEPKTKSKKLDLIKQNIKLSEKRTRPDWLEMDIASLKGKVLRLPDKEELDQEIETSLIIEYYSR
ncbi:30S ribosomal protein S4 [Candidatus Aerophobetes bacterium]|nr:30S ribosomal protein S4 [Candidatus Aerophobetes bacterium]